MFHRDSINDTCVSDARKPPAVTRLQQLGVHERAAAVYKAFAEAFAGFGTIQEAVLKMPGMSGTKYRRFINNLMRILPHPRYLEVGAWAGSTLCSAIDGNSVTADRALALTFAPGSVVDYSCKVYNGRSDRTAGFSTTATVLRDRKPVYTSPPAPIAGAAADAAAVSRRASGAPARGRNGWTSKSVGDRR
jgi:hypothetical protein